jgi:general secretion pathway protein J
VAWSRREQGWLRWAGPVATQASALQDQWLASQQLLGNEPGHLLMIDGLADWQVYFYRTSAWSNAQSSADIQAPAGAASGVGATAPRAQLPTGVRIVLDLDGRGVSGKLTRDILLAPQMP